RHGSPLKALQLTRMQRWFGLRANPSLALKNGAEVSFIPRPTWLYKNGSECERSEGRCPDRGARLSAASLTFRMTCPAIPRHARKPICGRDGCVGGWPWRRTYGRSGKLL